MRSGCKCITVSDLSKLILTPDSVGRGFAKAGEKASRQACALSQASASLRTAVLTVVNAAAL